RAEASAATHPPACRSIVSPRVHCDHGGDIAVEAFGSIRATIWAIFAQPRSATWGCCASRHGPSETGVNARCLSPGDQGAPEPIPRSAAQTCVLSAGVHTTAQINLPKIACV